MYNQYPPNYNQLPPVPPLRTPIYSGRLHIGTLDHQSKRIKLFHNPYPLTLLSLEPGSYILDHLGHTVGRLGVGGQFIRFPSQ